MQQDDLNRREFLAASVTSAAALTLVGCGGAGTAALLGTDDSGPLSTDTARAPAYSLHQTVMAADAAGYTYALDRRAGSLTQRDPGGSSNWVRDAGTFNGPTSVAVDSHGRILVSNTGERAIHELDANGRLVTTLGSYGSKNGEFRNVRDFAIDDDDRVYVADMHNHRIQVLAPDGSVEGVFGTLGMEEGELNAPRALAFDSYGELHVLSAGNARVEVFDRGGQHLRSYGEHGKGSGQLFMPADLAIGRDDRCYVVDVAKDCVEVFENGGYSPVGYFRARTGAGDPVPALRIDPDGSDGFFITTA